MLEHVCACMRSSLSFVPYFRSQRESHVRGGGGGGGGG